MDFSLTETQRLIQETARRVAAEVVQPRARETDRAHRFPRENLQALAEVGLLGVNVPEALGGSEAGVLSYSLAMSEIAGACAATAVTMAVTNMVGEIIARFGTEAQRSRHVPRLCDHRYGAGAFALSEPQAGSDASGLRTRAERRGEGWVLNGEKMWITSGDEAGVVVVWARTGPPGAKGISCFLVEGDHPGMQAGRPEEKMGQRGSSTVSLSFTDCELGPEALLGKEGEGFKIAMVALDGGRVGIASLALGIAQAALDASIEYAKAREAFGKPIAAQQAIQFKLADMATQIDTARLLTHRAAWLKEQGRPFTKEASMAKVFTSELANQVCLEAIQIHGGYGYVDDFPVERYLRDAKVTTIYEGTSEIQRLVIARKILEEA